MIRIFLLPTLLIIPLAVRGGEAEDAVRRDLKALEGTWELASLEVNGQQVDPSNLTGVTSVIKGTSYVLITKDKKFPVQIQLDPGKEPKHIDMIFQEGPNKDKVHRGIYRIEKDRFQISRGLNPEQERSREFATWPGTNCFVATWRRVK